MDLSSQKNIFNELYKDVDGYALSAAAQAKLPYYYNAHIYGEIDFDNFYEILLKAKPKQNDIFYDLGSGTGKAVVEASLCFPFAKCVGVEKLDELFTSSQRVATKLNNPNVQFIHEDFVPYDFSDGDVIYMNSYYFSYDMLDRRFLHTIEKLKKGARVLFVHTPLDCPFLTITDVSMRVFSWGTARVYTAERI